MRSVRFNLVGFSFSLIKNLIIDLIAFFLCGVFLLVVPIYSVAIRTIQLEQQQGALSEKLRSKIRNDTNSLVPVVILMVFFILAMLVGLSVTSMYYNGLKNVFASLDLPDLEKHFYVKDFEFLQDSRGAFTVHGFPVTLSRAFQLFQFVFVSTVASVVSLAYLSPYY